MISVVVASSRSAELLSETLAPLIPQCRAVGAELVVARSGVRPSDPPLPEECRLIRCEDGASIPAIRGAGLAAAHGDWVALTEDNCAADQHWLERLAVGFGGAADVVGGTMTNARPDRAIDCGASFAEYGFFGPWQVPAEMGIMPLLTGANVAYRRPVVEAVARWAIAGDWEDVIHGRLASEGATFLVVPDATIGQNLHYRVVPFMADRYRHGRDYARVRSREAPAWRRLLHALTTPLLPLLLTWRVWRSSGRGVPGQFLRALPYTLLFLSAWAVGEAVGYSTRMRAS